MKIFCLTTCLIAVSLCTKSPTMAQLQFSAAQGSTRSVTSEAVSITSLNGAPGFIAATTQRPFVMGLVPVVGDYGGAAAPVYGPAMLMPRYSPGPSVLQERIARLKQSGGIGSLLQSTGPNSPLPAVDSKSKFDKFQQRFAAAQEKSAGESIQSIASIRSQRATVEKPTERDIEALQTKMREAESAGKLQLARLYQREIERRSGDKQFAVAPSSR